ncbi:MAG: 8-amino-7-oxononanoate synthase [Bacteroidetes bacterium RIFCSPLOWO2_12_FULL_35_15]|nr:MAG: 8-amino-7-oxononanoate synthase [Bacteroidetes bacterium RIFCSPLOWO2_12_FULL_35_15]
MNFSADTFLQKSLQNRKDQNALRKLSNKDHLIDFCSNDYLGFAHSEKLKNNSIKEFASLPFQKNGSTGSRLLTGNLAYAEQLEKRIATFHNAESGLIYNSGYDANLGLFSALGKKGDTIIYDELIHASVRDGMKLSTASAFMFRHNDLKHLEERLKIATGIIYVAIETVYSMDGDNSPLKEVILICKKYKANLIVDEAHATGITRNKGRGRVQELKLEKEIFARVHTFGKALGCHGAIVLGSDMLRNYLINFSRSFIYTTALPVKSLVTINQAYLLLESSSPDIKKLNSLIEQFRRRISKNATITLIESNSPIQCIVVSGNREVKRISKFLEKSNFDVRPILSPTVPKGKERLRICIHSSNTKEELDELINSLLKIFKRNVQ